MNPIRIGILGYGNLGRGIELAVAANDDMELVGVFTRRDPASVHPLGENVAVWPATELAAHTDDIDVLMLAGGSATDLPEQTPAAAALYNVVDSFDTHANIPAHFAAVDAVARETGHVAVISVGWDPGMFSVSRVYANAIMPNGADYTFWGRGVSQGHSDAIRRIPGVADARQYTVPVPEALEAVRSGANPELTTRQKHTRECFVVAEEGADTAAIEKAIVTMPNYFADYDTTVTFVPQEELDRFVEEALELIDPVITCFNSANWEDVTSPEDVEMERFVDELMRKGLNPAQIYAEDRLEEEMKARILALQED